MEEWGYWQYCEVGVANRRCGVWGCGGVEVWRCGSVEVSVVCA